MGTVGQDYDSRSHWKKLRLAQRINHHMRLVQLRGFNQKGESNSAIAERACRWFRGKHCPWRNGTGAETKAGPGNKQHWGGDEPLIASRCSTAARTFSSSSFLSSTLSFSEFCPSVSPYRPVLRSLPPSFLSIWTTHAPSQLPLTTPSPQTESYPDRSLILHGILLQQDETVLWPRLFRPRPDLPAGPTPGPQGNICQRRRPA